MNAKDIDIWKEKTKGIFHITEHRSFWNYITNLQEEIKSANESVTWWTNRYEAVVRNCDETVKKMMALGEENERLKEFNENYPIEEQLEEALKYEKIYKSRNEKALYFIDMDKHISTNWDNLTNKEKDEFVLSLLIELENILQGENNDKDI